MKKIISSIMIASVLTLSAAAADTTVKISDMHICCGSCVKAIQKIVGNVPGATVDVDKDDESVTLTGADTATVQKATDALTAAGFYGTSSDPSIKINSDTGAKGAKMQTLKIDNVHLCCGKCVKVMNQVLTGVPGVTGDDAAKGTTTVTVTGDFNDKDVFDALQKAGFTGKEE